MTETPPPRVWLFGLAALPYGMFNGLIALSLPYLLRRQGISVERIAAVSALVQAPAIWYFLWAPAVDLRLRRRTWVILLAVASGACAAAALSLDMATSLGPVTALLVIGSVINQPISSALGGVVAQTVPDALRGRAAGWGQAGSLAGGVAVGALAVWLAEHLVPGVTALIVGLAIAVPSAVVLGIHEPKRHNPGVRRRVVLMVRELTDTFRRREAWVAVAFFVSPVGSGALLNLFSGIAVDFHASANVVVVAAIGGGLLTAVGALVGGVICDRFDRWRVYPVTGLLAAVSAGAMMLGPLAPATYLAGVAAYSLFAGFGYAAFMALALELLAEGTDASGTRFTLFIAATNIPLVYMLWIEGVGHTHFGVHGMLAIDAAANAAFGILFLAGLARAKAR